MADSNERIADEVATYQAPPNGQYIQVHPKVMRDWESRLRALSPAGGDWVIAPREMSQADCPHKGAYSFRDGWSTGWNDCLAAMRAKATPQPEAAHSNIAVGVDVTTEGTHVVVIHHERGFDTVIYSQFHPLAASPQQEPGAGELCKTCGGHGVVCYHTGQTPEQYEEHTEDCPECTPSGQTLAGAGGDVVIEAVGRIVADDEMGARVDWLTEGGIAAMEVGDFLCVTNATIPDDGLLTLTATSAGTTGKNHD